MVDPAQQVKQAHEKFLAGKISKANPKVNAQKVAKLIVRAADEDGMDPLALGALIKLESTFNVRAKSPSGALGLMQLMPVTAQYMLRKKGVNWSGSRDLHNPKFNLKLGIAYFKYLLGMFKGNYEMVFSAYNWGPGNLKNALNKKREMDPRCENTRATRPPLWADGGGNSPCYKGNSYLYKYLAKPTFSGFRDLKR